MQIPRVRFIWKYKGHNSGVWQRGPNWRQLTLPGSRNRRRVALILTWPS